MDVIFWGAIVRFAEAVLAGAPTLLVGLLVAGVLRNLVGQEATFRIFGGTSWRSLPQAWLWGMLLPVCSIGVIPVAYELRRAGLKGGAILAFALTAPLFNPLSLLYGLTLSTPEAILLFAFGSLVVVTTVGLLWDRLFPKSEIEVEAIASIPPGLYRIASVGAVAARHMVGPTFIYALIGFAGSILLAVIFPFASLTDSMAHDDVLAPVKMIGLALPAYATPLNVMMQVGSMFVHSNSVGAAYVLLSLGTGVNLGLIVWAWKTYGFKKATIFLIIFILAVTAVAYAVNNPLYFVSYVEHPHTHAFDTYACPFPSSNISDLPARTWKEISENAKIHEIASTIAVVGLLFLGVLLRKWDPENKLEETLSAQEKHPESAKEAWINVVIPGPVLGFIAILGLIVLSILGCFVYYPPTEVALEDMKYYKTETVLYSYSHDVEKAVVNITAYDDATRKLQVGYYLRHWHVSEFQQAKIRALLGRLEQLKDILEAKEFDRSKEAANAVSNAHRRVVEAFRESTKSGLLRVNEK